MNRYQSRKFATTQVVDGETLLELKSPVPTLKEPVSIIIDANLRHPAHGPIHHIYSPLIYFRC